MFYIYFVLYVYMYITAVCKYVLKTTIWTCGANVLFAEIDVHIHVHDYVYLKKCSVAN